MIFHLIRHGKTIATERGLYCGFTDLPLSANGRSELLYLKKHVGYPRAELYIASDLLRAAETVDILYDSPEFIAIGELREIDFGSFDMHGYGELKLMPEYVNWLNDMENTSPPDGESLHQFRARVLRGFARARRLCDEKLTESACIVAHGGSIAIIMEIHFPGKRSFHHWVPPCGRGYALSLEYDRMASYIEI